MSLEPMSLATKVVEQALAKGAQQAAVTVDRDRFIDLSQRDGKLEKINESTTAGLGLELFVDGRYAAHNTSDLRASSLRAFVDRAVAVTRLLQPDEHRGLADPRYYENRPTADLGIFDERHDAVDTSTRKAIAAETEAIAHQASDAIISVTSGYYDRSGESVRVHSNGFTGRRRSTSFWYGASVTVRDEDGRRPEDWFWVGDTHFGKLPASETVAKEAARRALGRRGQKKIASGDMTVILENRTAGRLARHLIGAMNGRALHQKRSFLLGKMGETVGSAALAVIDDPLWVGGLASQHFDADGISARKRTLVERGRLKEYLIDVYYARKLGVAPTGGSVSNLTIEPGRRDVDAMIGSIDHGVYVTGILGGNADRTTGDFSHGITGFEIVKGKLGGPVGEMNITGSHSDLWNRLVEAGNDPYPYSSWRLPTLVFDRVSVSGL